MDEPIIFIKKTKNMALFHTFDVNDQWFVLKAGNESGLLTDQEKDLYEDWF
ncbi:hypothetical protein [Shouchella shacheensis]|uniref:hypothetical protein n=1 Tax=Shouchella shacheensis TaxID=1649580 RepID=UPI001C5A2A0D|nr:hypothetical protein [Shouchella shacheensis]